jgi:hypothetical protein
LRKQILNKKEVEENFLKQKKTQNLRKKNLYQKQKLKKNVLKQKEKNPKNQKPKI